MFKNALIHLRRRLFVGGSAAALATACLGGAGAFAADPDKAVDKISTATPIKHVLIIVGENRSFDHLYATYLPKNRDERVLNLLSERIINADGSPGKNFAKDHQFQVTSAPNGGKYFVSVDLKNKSPYTVLPARISAASRTHQAPAFSSFQAAIRGCHLSLSSCLAPAARVLPRRSAPTRASPMSPPCLPAHSR